MVRIAILHSDMCKHISAILAYVSAFTFVSYFARVVYNVARSAHSHVDSRVAQDRVVFAKDCFISMCHP